MKRILIISAGLQYGGVERFVTNIIKFAPADEFQFDYLIFEGFGDSLAPEIIDRGGRVITIPSPQKGYRRYIKKLGDLIDENHYDIVHSHTQFNSGINLWVARKHKVPVRIAHSHTTAHENAVSAKQRLYENAMRRLIKRSATHFCSCGVEAGKWMYGDHPFVVIPNGIDTDLFAYHDQSRKAIRNQYKIDPDAFVIGHSGTVYPLKNQEFLIRILPGIRKRQKNAELMLIGTGSDEEVNRLKRIASECQMTEYVHFTGAVMNINEHLSAFDVFAFPSLREGTPLALLEAQANGLPCVISDTIPQDAIITDLVMPLSLNDKDAWISNICKVSRNDPEKYCALVSESGFDARKAYQKLFDIYNNN
ncbi:MAG: glycosyltransferase [Ruminococcus sp.]|uniref:glycosyltransferase n=1 Tax=Ruminococcus sp. TaxID=41978 RepID=UPI0028733434|nr:glycosyltransferase [Ruminococcus sp.]MBQ3285219.1 glycosyltransferase [Ruminococcus sp.]